MASNQMTNKKNELMNNIKPLILRGKALQLTWIMINKKILDSV